MNVSLKIIWLLNDFEGCFVKIYLNKGNLDQLWKNRLETDYDKENNFEGKLLEICNVINDLLNNFEPWLKKISTLLQ